MALRSSIRLLTLAILSALAFGCVGETVEGSTGELVMIDEADFEGRLFYLDARISPRPMTAEELGDVTGATPVGVRFHEHFAVAWAAPNGRARVGDPESVVAAWVLRELPSADGAELLAADVAGEEESTTEGSAPTYGVFPIYDDVLPTFEDDLDTGGPSVHLVDWIEENSNEFINYWVGHPGCVDG